MNDISRLAISQATTRSQWNLREAIEGYSKQGVKRIGIWREGLAACGLREAKQLLGDHGMAVTGLSRAGPFFGMTGDIKPTSVDDDRRAVDEAAACGAEWLLALSGGMPPGSKDLPRARARMQERLGGLLEYARTAGVALAIEPLHPMYAADRSFINTLDQAIQICDSLGKGIGIIVDVYHVWWDPNLRDQIKRIGRERIVGFHVCDWLVPMKDVFQDRGMMGDGVIDIPGIRGWVEEAGYRGPIEVEIFSQTWWKRPPEDVVRTCIERFHTCV